MTVPSPILVATDLSERSDRALHRAFALARTHSVPVVALHVLDDAMPEDMIASVEQQARDKLERACSARTDGVDYTAEVVRGDPTGQVLKALGRHDAGLLVVGQHRHRPFLDLLRETTVMRIVRRGDTPVLMVRDAADRDYGAIVAAIDFSPGSEAALQLARALAPEAGIHPVHAVHVPYSGMLGPSSGGADLLAASFVQDAEQQALEWSKSTDLPNVTKARTIVGPAYSVLWKEIESRKADLICLGAHGRAGSAPSILGTLANDFLRDAPCDVLVARPRHRKA